MVDPGSIKLVVRDLAPGLKSAEFLRVLEERCAGMHRWASFLPGHAGPLDHRPAVAHVAVAPASAAAVREALEAAQPCRVSAALFPRLPRPRAKENRAAGTYESNASFQAFRERFEAASVAKAVDASALERQPATGGAGAKEEKAERPVVHTALMAYLRDQRARRGGRGRAGRGADTGGKGGRGAGEGRGGRGAERRGAGRGDEREREREKGKEKGRPQSREEGGEAGRGRGQGRPVSAVGEGAKRGGPGRGKKGTPSAAVAPVVVAPVAVASGASRDASLDFQALECRLCGVRVRDAASLAAHGAGKQHQARAGGDKKGGANVSGAASGTPPVGAVLRRGEGGVVSAEPAWGARGRPANLPPAAVAVSPAAASPAAPAASGEAGAAPPVVVLAGRRGKGEGAEGATAEGRARKEPPRSQVAERMRGAQVKQGAAVRQEAAGGAQAGVQASAPDVRPVTPTVAPAPSAPAGNRTDGPCTVVKRTVVIRKTRLPSGEVVEVREVKETRVEKGAAETGGAAGDAEAAQAEGGRRRGRLDRGALGLVQRNLDKGGGKRGRGRGQGGEGKQQ